MVSGIDSKKLKVVWLCHFANQEMTNYFNTPGVNEMTPWINNLIDLFKTRTDVDLHIVAPNVFTNRNCSFVKESVNYHFYPLRLPLIPKKVNTLFKLLFGTDYKFIKSQISKIIHKIDPDIIHLHGAENPYYSAGILPLIGEYPALLTIQGFARKASSINKEVKKRIAYEELIIKNIKYFGVRTGDMKEVLLSLNPKAKFFFHNYPFTIPKHTKSNESTFDIIFFARISKDKGIEDLLQAMKLMKRVKPDISLMVIGSASKSYLLKLQLMCRQLQITTNVKFLGFMKTQNDIYKIAVKAKICVLPSYHDINPGTIIESMYMKLPVVTYNVTGMSELNEKKNTVMLVEQRNVNQLAEKTIQLLKNTDLQNTLAQNAYTYAQERFNNNNIPNDILNAYQSILTESRIR